MFMEEPVAIWAFNAGDNQLLNVWYDMEGVDWDAKDTKGQTLLHIACQLGSNDTAKKLLEKGASANVADEHGWIPLFYAVKASNWDAVQTLLPKSDLSFKSDLGETALHIAVKFNKVKK